MVACLWCRCLSSLKRFRGAQRGGGSTSHTHTEKINTVKIVIPASHYCKIIFKVELMEGVQKYEWGGKIVYLPSIFRNHLYHLQQMFLADCENSDKPETTKDSRNDLKKIMGKLTIHFGLNKIVDLPCNVYFNFFFQFICPNCLETRVLGNKKYRCYRCSKCHVTSPRPFYVLFVFIYTHIRSKRFILL